MSTSVIIHVGPYAELLAPEDQARDHDLLNQAIETGCLNHNLEQREKVTIGDKTFARACFAPYASEDSPPEHRPPRPLHWSGNYWQQDVGVVDLTEVDRAAEMAWFEQTHAEALRLLAQSYGVPVRIRWGVMPSSG